ncbi:MAG: hypothetical protein AMJ81_11920 [Phycisphaerae bacterium SM23_33]|nr:MAG: hypothetical protein AMJ81_11920 [Phycisphaerae bacterium SM23_33]
MSPSKVLLIALIVIVAATLLAADPPPQKTSPTPATAPAPPADPLAKTLPKVEFSGIPLGDVIQYFRDVTGANIHIRWAALEQAGINKDTPVNIKAAGVTAQRALELVLEDAGGANPLDYMVKDGVIVISTADDLARHTETMTLDVRDLVDPTDDKAIGGLMDLIRENVAPDSWRQVGGRGAVSELNGALVVTNTPKAVKEVEALVESLRKVQTRRPASPGALARQADVKIRLVSSMKETCDDPAAMGLIGVAGLRDEAPREAKDVIADLEALLASLDSLTLRNAVRLALKDLYRVTGDQLKLLQTLKDMVTENDGALSRRPGPRPTPRPSR